MKNKVIIIPAPSANVSNSIVEGTTITGNIIASNDIRIDGILVGKTRLQR
ncbi:MAG: hypothetical protein IPN86_12560 [Saprospiraceae bacterium]|nr:hypothetical protein [Saprospiraceae bacterium]